MDLKSLTQDLKRLNQEFDELTLQKDKILEETDNPIDNDLYKKILIERATTVTRFYKNVFIPKYSKINDRTIEKVGIYLEDYYHIARKHIKKKDYFGLSVFFINRGNQVRKPNNLEKLIKSLE